MELFKRFFNKRYREEFSKEISLKLNEEQYDYERLYFSIFKERYVTDKSLNSYYYKMIRDTDEMFLRNNYEYKVASFIGENLLKDSITEDDRILTCLLIPYRWRTNFFKRNQDHINVKLQYKNFSMANKIIATILLQYKN